MADAVVRTVGTEEVQEYLAKLPERMFSEAKDAFTETATGAHAKVKERIGDGSGDTLHSRTGQLARSIQFKVYGDTLRTLGASVFSEKSVAPYAAVHEKGATIRAKDKYLGVPGGPYLNIPTQANKTAAGVQRLSARDVFAAGGFVVKGPQRYVVMSRDGTPMFVLVNQVTIPARLQMVETVEGELPTLLSRLDAALQSAIE